MAISQDHGSREFTWNIVGAIIITRQAPEQDVSDSVWNEFLRVLESGKFRHIFSFTVGNTSIKATQRKSAADILKREDIPATVMTDNRMTRGILTAVSWLGAKVKAFSWAELDAAMDAANVPLESRAEVKRLATEFLNMYGSKSQDT
jgi:hypothetical protein